MTSRVVVAWDGSAASRAAFRWALTYVQDAIRRLTIVHAVDGTTTGHELADADVTVRTAARAVADRPDQVALDVEVHRGAVDDVLLAAVDAASLLVVGHDPVPAARRTFPSVAVRSVTQAPCSVVVVPVEGAGARSADVVVGVDDAGGSAAALRFGAREARRTAATLRAVTVWSPPEERSPEAPHGARTRETARRRRAQRLEESVEEALLEFTDVDVVRQLSEGPVGRRLLDAAEDAALLVVGAGGCRGRVGDVGAEVARHAVVPTAIVRG